MNNPIPETCEEALARWDAGETVFTAEMGGLGPGYEQAIQETVCPKCQRATRTVQGLRPWHEANGSIYCPGSMPSSIEVQGDKTQ